MAAVAVYVPVRVAVPKPPKSPTVVLVTDTGVRFALPYGPRGAKWDGWADEVGQLDRPGRRALTVRTADGLPGLAFDVFLGRASTMRTSIDPELLALQRISGSGQRISIAGLSRFEQGPWRMNGCTIEVLERVEGTNAVAQATVSLSFVAAVEPPTYKAPTSVGTAPKGSAALPKATKHVKKTFKYKMKKGDTLRALATRYYGNAQLWTVIAKASKIKDVNKIKVGSLVTIPKL